MSKYFKYFMIAWAILLIAFNVATFLSPSFPNALFDGFWVGYGFVNAALIGFLICSFVAFRVDNADKQFLHMPVIALGWIGLIVCGLVGIAFMIFPVLPGWITAIICMVLFLIFMIAVISAKAVASMVSDRDEELRYQTGFIRYMTSESEILMNSVTDPNYSPLCKEVYEAVRYSDPMSRSDLSGYESAIHTKFQQFSGAVRAGDAAGAQALESELLGLIKERNTRCKMMK